MDADEIRAWFVDRYDEDERVAQGAINQGGRGRAGEGQWHQINLYRTSGMIGDMCGGVVTYGSGIDGLNGHRAAHIVLHDPARVLREVAAKRRRLERHRGERRRIVIITDRDDGETSFGFFVCVACTPHRTVCRYYGERVIEWPCPEVVDDAQSYTNRNDFPEELRLP